MSLSPARMTGASSHSESNQDHAERLPVLRRALATSRSSVAAAGVETHGRRVHHSLVGIRGRAPPRSQGLLERAESFAALEDALQRVRETSRGELLFVGG